MNCDPELWTFLASQNQALEWSVRDILEDRQHRMHAQMRALHSAVAPDLVERVLGDALFRLRFGEQSIENQEYWGRVLAIASELGGEFIAYRVRVLRSQNRSGRPPPYDHPSLASLTPDSALLVPFEKVQHDGSLSVGSVVCQATLTTPSSNSMYWAMGQLGQLTCERRVRLDPLLVCPADEYRAAMYRMTVYGVPLDWGRLGALREPLHGRWMPDPGSRPSIAFTEIVWTPRDDGVHFACEEVPTTKFASSRGARYFHSIYDPVSEAFVHADGALRLYSDEELVSRQVIHLRKGGKMGSRAKVFVANGRIDRAAWCRLVTAFFVWNADVESYFGGKEMTLENGE